MNTPTALPPVEGGCLCGQVRYLAAPDHRDGYYCHCRMCQLAVGNTRAAFLNLKKSQVQWLGAPAYYASSKIARRAFCNRCGTPLSFEFVDGENMDLTVGSLDEPSAFKPESHFAIESRIAAWHAPDGLKELRLDTNERITQRWRAAYGDAVQPGIGAVKGDA